MFIRPKNSEYPDYFRSYIDLVPEGNITSSLTQQHDNMQKLFSGMSENQLDYRYAEGKWSLKEVLGHMTDTERIMTYRLLRISRGDQTPLQGFSEDDYVREAGFQFRKLSDLLEDYHSVRMSTISLLNGIPYTAWERKGIANGYEITARAIPYMIAGHELHHLKIIEERYLSQ
jgi:uncharacterized damage-inducible protein DinB